MTDPTHSVLSTGLILTLATFTVASVIRATLGRKHPQQEMPVSTEDGAEAPTPPRLPAGNVPVWQYHPLDLIGAGFIFLMFCGSFLLSKESQQPQSTAITAGALAANIVLLFAMAGATAGLVFWRIPLCDWLGLRWKNWHLVFLIAPCAVFSMWMVSGILYLTGYMKWMDSIGVETVQDTVMLLQKSDNPWVIGLMVTAAVVAAPICEEILFRGYLYPVLKRFSGAWTAGICSAFIFAAAHGNLTALIPLFLLGALLVAVYEKTGSIWAPVAIHFTFNSATVIIQLAARWLDIPIDPNL